MELDDKQLGLELTMLPAEVREEIFDGIDPIEFGFIYFNNKDNKIYCIMPNLAVLITTIPEYKKKIAMREIQDLIKKNNYLYETT